jgi:hypothetical protein
MLLLIILTFFVFHISILILNKTKPDCQVSIKRHARGILIGYFIAIIYVTITMFNVEINPFEIYPIEVPIPIATPITVPELQWKTFLAPDGSAIREATLSIDPLGPAAYHISAPSSLRLGESSYVQLKVMLHSASQHLPTPTQTQPRRFHEGETKLYPYMVAELTGVNFRISPEGRRLLTVTHEHPVAVWSWTIAPEQAGPQSLVLSISVPVEVPGRSDSSHQLTDTELQIAVTQAETSMMPTTMPTTTVIPTPRPATEMVIDNLIASPVELAVGSMVLLGSVFGTLAVIANGRRTQRIEELKLQLEREKLELQREEELERQRTRLESARWWQFWRW